MGAASIMGLIINIHKNFTKKNETHMDLTVIVVLHD